jgi:DNA-directed RNA polymerase I and III subunit RPAC1
VKLRPGQAVDIVCFCHLGIGADHAKFSPVATAWYRLLPSIQILSPILGNDARKFARCFPKGVIGLRSVTDAQAKKKNSPYEGNAGEPEAYVADAMKDTVSREVLRHEEFVGKVKLGRVKDHFIFKIESTGQVESTRLLIESIKILKAKAARARRLLDELSKGT